MKRMIVQLITASLLVLMSTVVFAAELKIGVIDLREILQKSPQMIAISKQLKKQFATREEKVITAQKSLKNEMDKLHRDGPVMSSDERSKLESKIVAEKRKFERVQQEYREDVMAAQNQSMQKLLAKLDKVVKQIAAEGHYDLILQKEGVPFASNRVDISGQLLKALNKSSKDNS